jgi:predicted amidophosphoribosyltransferase
MRDEDILFDEYLNLVFNKVSEKKDLKYWMCPFCLDKLDNFFNYCKKCQEKEKKIENVFSGRIHQR